MTNIEQRVTVEMVAYAGELVFSGGACSGESYSMTWMSARGVIYEREFYSDRVDEVAEVIDELSADEVFYLCNMLELRRDVDSGEELSELFSLSLANPRLRAAAVSVFFLLSLCEGVFVNSFHMNGD